MKLAQSISRLLLNFSIITAAIVPHASAFSIPTTHNQMSVPLTRGPLKYHLAQTPPLPKPLPGVEIQPVNSKVNVKLMNTTGAIIIYQVLGDTKPRTLLGNAEYTLQNLKLPVTVTFHRQDHGLLTVNLQPSTIGVLDVTFSATNNFSLDKQALTISQRGKVYLN